MHGSAGRPWIVRDADRCGRVSACAGWIPLGFSWAPPLCRNSPLRVGAAWCIVEVNVRMGQSYLTSSRLDGPLPFFGSVFHGHSLE